MALKPSSKFLAKALQKGDMFIAQFSAPGLVPDFVQLNGRTVRFSSAMEAENAACRALFNILNNRPTTIPIGSKTPRMNNIQLSRSLDEAGITASEFARLSGANLKNVYGWLDGTKDISIATAMFAEMIKDQHTLDLMKKNADKRSEVANNE